MMGVELVFGFELVAHVAVAAERLDIGPQGAGWMTAVVGLGGVLGASWRRERPPATGPVSS